MEKGTILVVDDTPSTLGMLKTTLGAAGYEVLVTTSGEKALEGVVLRQPELILLDILMPGMDGYETCRRLKANEKTKAIPVIFLSALAKTFDKVKGFELGAVDYVTKPIEIAELLARVRTHLTLHRLQQELQELNRTLEEKVQIRTEELSKTNEALKQEIEDRKQAEKALSEERNLLRTLIDNLPEYIYVKDTESRFLLANEASVHSLGQSTLEDLIDKTDFDLFPKEIAERLYADERNVIETGQALINQEETIIDRETGATIWFLTTKVPFRDTQRNIVGIVGLSLDITERKRMEEELKKHHDHLEELVKERTTELQREITERKHMETALAQANRELQRLASLDGLTQIANRRRFDEYFLREWKRQAREQTPLSLILCDIDFFKRYNDTYGHLAGDECLRQVAQVIDRAARRPADLAARYGGEEFVMVLPNTEAEGANQIARTIRQSLQDLKIPHAQSSVSGYVTLSIGVSSVIPKRACSPELLVNTADQAMYEAKEQGRNAIILKTPTLT